MTIDPRDKGATRRFYRNLGARIRAARLAAGLSQQELADAVGVARASIANLEAGRQHTPAHTLALIMLALGTDPSGVLTGEDMWQRVDEFTNLADDLAAADDGTRDFVAAALASLDAGTGAAP